MRVLWQLVRPLTSVLVLLHGLLAWALVATELPGLLPFVSAALLLPCWYAHAVAVNDLSDVEVDRINLTDSRLATQRPLVNASSTPTRLWGLVAGLTVAMVLSAFLVSRWLTPVAALMAALNCAYSLPPWRWSARGALAQLTLPIGYVWFPAVVGYALAAPPAPPSPAAVGVIAGLAVLFCGRLFCKDIRDERGDRATGKRTFLVRHGLTPTLRLAGALMVAGVVVSATALLLWLGQVVVTLLLVAGATLVLTPWALRRLAAETDLARRLLWVGFVGRLGSAWLFGCLLVVVAERWSSLPGWQVEVLVGLAAAMFGFGLTRFAEEARSGRMEP